MMKPWRIDSFEEPAGEATVTRVGACGYLIESGTPGGHRYVHATETDAARVIEEAQRDAERRYRRTAYDALTLPTRRVLGRDVLRGLLGCGGELLGLTGTPRVVRFAANDVLLTWEDHDEVPAAAIASLARAAGLDLETLEEHAGITATRALEARNVAAVQEARRRLDAAHRLRAAEATFPCRGRA